MCTRTSRSDVHTSAHVPGYKGGRNQGSHSCDKVKATAVNSQMDDFLWKLRGKTCSFAKTDL